MEDYKALLAVDAEGFSTHSDAALPDLHLDIQETIGHTCMASGLAEAWASATFKESTGDGVLVILPLTALPRLVAPFASCLQNALAALAPRLRAKGVRLRVRVAVHVGPVDDRRTQAPGISKATIDVSRLLDSDSLRAALSNSDPDVTFVALLLSSEAFEYCVEGGRTSLRPSQFTRVEATAKQFHRPAYLHVPTPSVRPDQIAAEPATRLIRQARTVNRVRQGNLNTGVIHGDQIFRGRDV
ncbi:hypothetical protein [Thermomonospora cellulosilytica]|uniref:Uncharacterized protein n=1 Tax=Thermomonospora cellulosilytica TaxID=1411118 RepID=A0A7W3R7A0_9ACTN|nr:hypothetical protein [Thermomonospora cellulosilytica]MBA9003028.1 hypothetical protein [Thermomonospora cellulosilytica]